MVSKNIIRLIKNNKNKLNSKIIFIFHISIQTRLIESNSKTQKVFA